MAEPAPREGGTSIGVLPLLIVFMVNGFLPNAAAQTETPLDILAVRVREQGHPCDKPIKAERDQSASQPLATVWLLQCSNARYRVVLHPDMGAQIEVIK